MSASVYLCTVHNSGNIVVIRVADLRRKKIQLHFDSLELEELVEIELSFILHTLTSTWMRLLVNCYIENNHLDAGEGRCGWGGGGGGGAALLTSR